MQIAGFVFNEDGAVAEWVSANLKQHPVFQKFIAIGMVKNGTPIAGVVYHDHERKYGDIQMSIASTDPGWCTKRSLGVFLGYPFLQLKCNRVTAVCHQRNKRARDFLKRVGFKEEGVLRQKYHPRDAVVYGMLKKEAAKWLRSDKNESR